VVGTDHKPVRPGNSPDWAILTIVYIRGLEVILAKDTR
jgi:hypothetical protein